MNHDLIRAFLKSEPADSGKKKSSFWETILFLEKKLLKLPKSASNHLNMFYLGVC